MTTVFRHLWAGADSGTAVTTEPDDTGNGNALAITFDGDGNWLTDAGGRGIEFAYPGTTQAYIAKLVNIVANGNVGSALANATKIIYIIRCRVDAGIAAGSRVMSITTNSGFSSDFGLHCNDAEGLSIAFNRLVGGGNASFTGPFSGTYTLIFDVDTTLGTAVDRVKLSINGAAFVSANSCDIPQNNALTGINATDRSLCYFNRPDTGREFDGAIFFDELRVAESITDGNAADIHAALVANHDSAIAPPVLTWVAEPAVDTGTITSSGATITLTTSLAATVKMIDTVAGSSVPDGAAWSGASVIDTTVAYEIFDVVITGQSPETTRRKWFQIVNGATTLYDYADLTTTAVSTSIVSVNGGLPIRYDQTSFNIVWDVAPGSPAAVEINGVTQGAHTGVNGTTTSVARTTANWPLAMYGQVLQLETGAELFETSMAPPTGYTVVTLSGYTENPPATPDVTTTGGDPAAVGTNGSQFVFDSSTGAAMDPDGKWKFPAGFSGTVPLAYVDVADGVHSAFANQYFGEAADVTPTPPTLIANVTAANPGQVVRGSFVLAGADPGFDIPVAAVADMLVSIAENGTYGPSITRQNGQTIYYQIIAGTYEVVRTGNVTMNGVTAAAPVVVTTRAAAVPVITVQPTTQTVALGANVTLTVTATGASTYQWRKAGVNISAATSSSYNIPSVGAGDAGSYSVSITSSEGGNVVSSTAVLTISGDAPVFVESSEGLANINALGTLLTGVDVAYELWAAGVLLASGSSATHATTGKLRVEAPSSEIGAVDDVIELRYPITGSDYYHAELVTVQAVV